MNCIIVDDDGTSRKIIEAFVDKSSDLALQGSFSNAPEALGFIKGNVVDLIFLDVEMPEMSGMEMLDALKPGVDVIFFTSKAEYAVEAFNKNAVDYLMKPITFDRFEKAVNKLRQNKQEDSKFIFVKSNSVLVKLAVSSIDYIESIGDYVGVHVGGKRYVVHTTMKEAEQKLPSAEFCRIHRSFIVNFNQIDQIEENTVSISNKVLPVSRTYRKILMGRLKTF